MVGFSSHSLSAAVTSPFRRSRWFWPARAFPLSKLCASDCTEAGNAATRSSARCSTRASSYARSSENGFTRSSYARARRAVWRTRQPLPSQRVVVDFDRRPSRPVIYRAGQLDARTRRTRRVSVRRHRLLGVQIYQPRTERYRSALGRLRRYLPTLGKERRFLTAFFRAGSFRRDSSLSFASRGGGIIRDLRVLLDPLRNGPQ